MAIDVGRCMLPGSIEVCDCGGSPTCMKAHLQKAPERMEKLGALSKQEGGSHYKDLKIQPIEYIHANELNFFAANIVKYVTRYPNKNGAEDLRKVIHYAQLALELQYGEKSC